MAKAEYKTVIKDGFSEVVEKKSRFLGEAVHAETLADAEAYIAAVKKRHYDARHHCFAFVVGEPGTPGEIARSSDDGEPSGTAGKPMLEVLTGRQLHKTLLVVTRYFGGTLLGTGGLHRAYSAAAKEAAEAAEIAEVKLGMRLMVTCSYTLLGKLQYLFAGEGIETIGRRRTGKRPLRSLGRCLIRNLAISDDLWFINSCVFYCCKVLKNREVHL